MMLSPYTGSLPPEFEVPNHIIDEIEAAQEIATIAESFRKDEFGNRYFTESIRRKRAKIAELKRSLTAPEAVDDYLAAFDEYAELCRDNQEWLDYLDDISHHVSGLEDRIETEWAENGRWER